VDSTSHGSLVLQGRIFATYVYTPAQDYFGADTFTYRVFDTVSLQADTGTVAITVEAVNDAPVAGNDEYSTLEEVQLVVDAPGILDNDEDVDDSLLTIELIGNVANGELNLEDDGSFIYIPDENFSGTDLFYYRLNDGESSSDIAIVTISVSEVHDPPVAEEISVTLLESENHGRDRSQSLYSNHCPEYPHPYQ
jgi:hypothetical protein